MRAKKIILTTESASAIREAIVIEIMKNEFCGTVQRKIIRTNFKILR